MSGPERKSESFAYIEVTEQKEQVEGIDCSERIQMSLNARLGLMAAHGTSMVAIGLALFGLRDWMTNVIFDVFGSAFALMLVGTSFLLSALLDWVFAVGAELHHIRELRRLLLASVIPLSGCLFLVIARTSTIRLLCYFTAAYALFIGIGKIRLARHWRCDRTERIIINLLGCLTICFSGILFAMANKDERSAIAVLGGYSLFVGLIMLLSTLYVYRQKSLPVSF